MNKGMLIESFSFGNFRSFKEINTLNMTSANIQSKDPELDRKNLIREGKHPELLKSKLIYGANASGKSNVVKALGGWIRILQDCIHDKKSLNRIKPYLLSSDTEGSPSFFQLVFWGDGLRYRYGFEATSEEINSEWLFFNQSSRETPIFIREKEKMIKLNQKQFKKGAEVYKLKSKLFNEKTLFLTVADSFHDKFANKVMSYIDTIFVWDSDLSYVEKVKKHRNEIFERTLHSKTGPFLLDTLQKADLNIKGLNLIDLNKLKKTDELEEDSLDKNYILFTTHPKYDKDKNVISDAYMEFLSSQSDGTRELLYLSTMLQQAFEQNRPIFIDEFGSKMHPVLTKQILELFNNEKHAAQLIAVTHHTELMSPELMRRDQIDFVEKDKYGESHLYTLVELKGIRKDANYAKDYLQGLYGAIPYVGNWDNLLDLAEDGESKEE